MTHYDVLGVSPGATDAVIRAAYKARMRETHPDAGGDPAEAQAVNTAYDVLSDPDRRAAHDRELQAAEPPAPAPAATPTATAPRQHTVSEPPPALPIHQARPFRSHLPWLAPVPVWIALIVVTFVTAAFEGAVAATGASAALAFATTIRSEERLAHRGVIRLSSYAVAVVALVSFNVEPIGYVTAGAGLASGIAGAVIYSHHKTDRAMANVDLFYEACQRPGANGWFVSSVSVNGNVTNTLLSDIDDPSRQISASVWGSVETRQYIAIDITQAPAIILATVSMLDVRRAARARRKQRQAAS